MATPAHARVACPEQKTPESGDQEGSESLKNGTTLEDSDDSTGNVLVKNRVRSPAASAGGNPQYREMTMDSFQDGGTAPQPNSRPSSANVEGSFPAAALDRSRLEYQGFNQSTTNNRDSEDFRNSQDNYNHGGGCDVGYVRGSYGGDQHGGQGNTSEMTTNSSTNKIYPQYNQAQMRPGYPQGPRSMGPQPRPYPGPNSSQQQQRFISGPSLSQQTGPTPTLNQLLQAPNSLQRYHNNYEYSGNQGMHKNMGDPNSAPQYQGPNSSWGNMRGASGYPQQMSSSMYRNQVTLGLSTMARRIREQWIYSNFPAKFLTETSKVNYFTSGNPMPDPSLKRPYNQMSSPAPPSQGQYPPQQQQQQYHPYSQSQQSPQGAPPPRPINQNYPPQQQYGGMQQHGPSQTSPVSYDHPRQPSAGPYGPPGSAQQSQPQTPQQPPPQQQQQPPPHPQPTPTPPQQQQAPPSSQQQQQQSTSPPQQQQQQPPQHPPSQQQSQQQHTPTSQQQQAPQSAPQQQSTSQSSQDASGSDELSRESSGGNITPGLRNPTTPPHPVVSPHRPIPSPSGSSTGSPSMSPALGQQPNIPMPPRPSSNQSETSGQVGQVPMSQPPLTAQGYNQQMAPPAMYSNKMHQNMMSNTGSHIPPYSPQQSGHYPQGGYHRPPSSMHSYGNQPPNNYPGPSYPAQTPMSGPHRMPTHPNSAPPSNYGPPSGGAGYSSSQYSGSGPPPPSGYGMNNMMPPPNQYPKSATMPPPNPGGAQAAAQAAVIAAAASSGGIRQSPMYLRQHLQQKIYANNYNSAISPGAPGSNGGQDTPMPPPASTPSSQPMSMNQSSMPPSTGSLGNASSCDGPVPASMVPAGFTQTSAPSLGVPTSTNVTQSISSPVPTAVTVSSPSVPDMMQSQQIRNSMGGPQGPPPPPVMDEGSQASNASASSSLPEERVETPKPNNKPTMSHPPTPNTLPSPGAASMSSFHDEFESVSSPSWPRTPASPVINNQAYDHHPIKRPDGMLKLYDLSDDPDRRLFLDKLIMYQEERGTPLSQCPTISKQPLDLYKLYLSAKERGGFVEVMKGKMWKEIAGLIGIGASSGAAYTLRKQYIKHLLPFECKFDRGGIDPGPLISSLESNSRKKNAAKNAGAPMMDGYGPSPYPGGYPPNAGHPGMMPGSDYPGPGHHPSYQDSMHHPGSMVNHSGSEGAMDPFSDEMQGSQYPQRHGTNDSYGYSQSNANTSMPPYSGNQPNAPSSSFGYSNTSGQQEPYNEQYSNAMVPPSDPNYSSRNMVPDPYAPPPGGYPPNRTVGPSNTSQYPPYQDTCNQERYDQNTPQGPMIRPNAPSSSVIGPSQPDSSYPSHRYPGPSMGGRENMPPQQMGSYQGRPMGPSQYPGPNSQTSGQSPYPPSQQDSYRSSEFQPQMSRLQSTLIQRLLPKNQASQNYPGSQQGMYGQSMPPPNKVAPPGNIPPGNMYQRDMYNMGPKRHSDYPKGHGPMQDQYHMGNYPQQQSQGPYGDRSQYPYRPSHGVPPQTPGPPQQGWPRDNRQYSGQGQYPPNQRDSWDISRHGEGPPPPGGPGWSRYGAPQPDGYSHHMGPSMGPKMMPRGYGGPNKMSPHGGVGPPPQYAPPSQRKEVIFPPDAVEAVTPLITKRRRLVSKDITPIEAWRIMMALKSGLIGESTWALDVLTILVHDDATVLYFGLSHLPGLLEVLMDHYRRCLNLIFDLVGDLEVGFIIDPKDSVTQEPNRKWYELESDLPTVDLKSGPCSNALSGDKTSILNSTNYTYKTRCKKVVRTQEEEALFLFDPDKKWDVHEGFISGSSHWQHGGGEYTGYIQTHFENTERCVRFARVIKESETKNSETNSGVKNKSSKVKLKNCKRECGGSDTEEDESLSSDSSKVSMSETSSDVKMEVCDESSSENNKKTSSVVMPTNPSPQNSGVTSDKKGDSESGTKSNSENNPKPNENSDSSFPKIRPMTPTRKRRALEDLEDESYTRDEPSLCTTSDAQDSLARRCICISSILRNLSFVPGNDTEMSKHSGFLLVMGRLLLLNHVHSPRKPPQRHYDREEEGESSSVADSCSSLNSEHEWWWDMLHLVRENTLVTLANISGQLDLAPFPEEISFPILDGLMHWVTCPSSYAQDSLPTQPSHSVLSPQRLSLEALGKLSVLESNVDLMMATPPWERIDRFFALLSKWLSRNEDQVLREFSVVLLSNLSQADSSMARAIALQGTCIPLLITFVEQAEQSALQVANSQGINALRENPELMGTTLDMVRRAAGTLRCLARVPTNRTLFLQHQQRLLALVMSQILDQGVASIIADVLFECSQEDAEELSSSVTNVERVSIPLAVEAAT